MSNEKWNEYTARESAYHWGTNRHLLQAPSPQQYIYVGPTWSVSRPHDFWVIIIAICGALFATSLGCLCGVTLYRDARAGRGIFSRGRRGPRGLVHGHTGAEVQDFPPPREVVVPVVVLHPGVNTPVEFGIEEAAGTRKDKAAPHPSRWHFHTAGSGATDGAASATPLAPRVVVKQHNSDGVETALVQAEVPQEHLPDNFGASHRPNSSEEETRPRSFVVQGPGTSRLLIYPLEVSGVSTTSTPPLMTQPHQS